MGEQLNRFIFRLDQIRDLHTRERVRVHLERLGNDFFAGLREAATQLRERDNGNSTWAASDSNSFHSLRLALQKCLQCRRDACRHLAQTESGTAPSGPPCSNRKLKLFWRLFRQTGRANETIAQEICSPAMINAFLGFYELLVRLEDRNVPSDASTVVAATFERSAPIDQPITVLQFQRENIHKASSYANGTPRGVFEKPDGQVLLGFLSTEAADAADEKEDAEIKPEYGLTALLQEGGSADLSKVQADFVKLCQTALRGFVKDVDKLKFNRPTGSEPVASNVHAPKYCAQISGNVWSLYMVVPLSQTYCFVCRLLRVDVWPEDPAATRTDRDHLKDWFEDSWQFAGNGVLPEAILPDQFADRGSLGLQAVFLSAYAILKQLLQWVKDRKPNLKSGEVAEQLHPVDDTPLSAPTQSGSQKDSSSATSSQGRGKSKRQLAPRTLVPLKPKGGDAGTAKTAASFRYSPTQFDAVDPERYALLRILYDHRRSKVWTAVRLADGVEVVIKWCSRSTALRSVQVHLALSGTDGVSLCRPICGS